MKEYAMEERSLGPGNMKRMVSIEILRGLAIMLMVQKHSSLSLAQIEGSSWVFSISMALGGLPAPIFSFLFGLSLYLWLEKKIVLGWSEVEMTKSIVRRGLFLFMFGLVFVSLTWGPDKIFTWDILTFLGTSAVILIPFRKWSAGRLIVLALVVIIISPPLRAVTGYAAVHEDGIYWDMFTVKHVVLGWLLHASFPVLPWIVFPLMGFAVGKQLTSDSDGSFIAGRPVLVTGLGFACMAGVSAFVCDTVPRSLEGLPATTPFILSMVGIACLGLWILNQHLDNKKEKPVGIVVSFFKRYSLFAFTIYIVHLLALTWSVRVIAMWRNADLNDCWNQFPPAVVILVAILFIVVFDLLLRKLETRRQYSIEGFLRWLM